MVAGDGTSKRRAARRRVSGGDARGITTSVTRGFHEVESALPSEESRRLLGESLWKDPFDALESRGADPTPLDAEVESYIVEVLTEEQLKLGAQQQKGREGAADKNIPPSTVTSSSGSFVDSKASSGGTSRVVGSPSCSQSPTKREGSSSSEVSIRVEELSWSCSEEKHTNGQDGRLLLWFPVNITHTINRYSPLYRYMKNNALCHTAAPPGTSQLESCSTASPKGKGNSDSGTVCPFNFQLVVMFDASETDIGRSLTARHTYSAEEIIKHYRFSNKVIRVAPDKSEIVVDYHYFNEMVPDSLSSPHRVH
uniref:Uncharacterized protein TCIL3000_11_13050 n=1 Tax=Trypanosoma congolense (strain IL3000) TaxID=1068625 RepID=G0V2D4_TRYCI|nr:unnamed protein product [Trypanosoma congolense IL3000]